MSHEHTMNRLEKHVKAHRIKRYSLLPPARVNGFECHLSSFPVEEKSAIAGPQGVPLRGIRV